MKVLFVSSAKNDGQPSSIIYNQGESLRKAGVDISYFTISGRGLSGYLRSIPRLRRATIEFKPALIHAHYALSGYISIFIRKIPRIVSLMGSDVFQGKLNSIVLKICNRLFWDKSITKSTGLKNKTGFSKSIVIPNGVNTNRFKPLSMNQARKKLGLDSSKTLILFPSDSGRYEKNFSLAESSVEKAFKGLAELISLKNVDHAMVPFYYNAVNVVLLTSLWEGSPNSIKEAMACSRPIVATDVGDIKWVFGEIEGTYITDGSVDNTVEQLLKAFSFERSKNTTKGRDRIFELDLGEESVAARIIEVYRESLNG